MKLIKKISSGVGEKLQLKTFTLLVVLSTVISQQALGQFTDNFSDGDLTNDPAWISDALTHWMVNNGQLQSNSELAGSSFYLTTPSSQTHGQWEFFVNLQFRTSGSNYVDVYLLSENQDLNEAGNNGYFVRIGDTDDEISLYTISGGIEDVLIDGADKIIDVSSVTLKIKVTRDENDLWTLSRDISGTGDSYVEEGSKADNTFSSANFFGIRIQQSTTSFHKKHFFDDFYTGEIIVDSQAPQIQTVDVISATELEVVFSEEVAEASAINTANYSVDHTIGHPISAELLPDNKAVRLVFTTPFSNGSVSTLTVTGVTDLHGNVISSANADFVHFQPVAATYHDLIVTEIFADPLPPVGLPEAEFIELYNRSDHPFDLAGWSFSDGSSTGNLNSLILLPGEYLTLSTASAQPNFVAFGKAIAVSSFPSLNNTADFVILKDNNGVTIDSVAYASSWYHDDEKADGGWSLERIDPENFCKGALNWKASIHASGGTPGQQNSVFEIIPDITGPVLLSASKSGERIVTLAFDEVLDKNLPPAENILIDPPVEIISVDFDESFTRLILSLSKDLDSAVMYQIQVTEIFDCPGNKIEADAGTVVLRLDTIPPAIRSVNVLSSFALEVVFSEKVNRSSAENPMNYSVSGDGVLQTAVLLPDEKTASLTFEQPFINGVESTLRVTDIADRAGNVSAELNAGFMFFEPVAARNKDVIITEILADPTPVIGLPEVEFVEIFNRSNSPFNLQQWKLSDAGNIVNFPSKILLPGTYLIVCRESQVEKFMQKGAVMGVTNFPTLTNAGEPLVLKDETGNTIDSVNFTIDWYKDDEKKDGGWSLELIDPENTCSESGNWIASENISGGTPGKQNSVYASKPDLTGPKLLSVVATSAQTLQIQFDEKLERILPSIQNFSSEPHLDFSSIAFTDLSLRSLTLTLVTPLQTSTEYQLTVSDVYDCSGNIIQESDQHTFALPEPAAISDIVINEILFNPRPTGVDFVEVYNRSSKFINLNNWKFANIVNDTVANATIITPDELIIKPGSYRVFTEEANVLKGEYINAREETFVETDLPSFADDEGSVALVTSNGEIIDSFVYTDDYHSPFVKDEEGVSLERISVEPSSTDSQNWKSASSSAGYATPGYLNSNVRSEAMSDDAVAIEPEIFMPVYGQPNFTQIRFHFEGGGYVANVKIFDRQGREIKQLANNELLGTEGFFRWDGDDESGSKARIGTYMIWFEVFDPYGSVKTFRKSCDCQ